MHEDTDKYKTSTTNYRCYYSAKNQTAVYPSNNIVVIEVDVNNNSCAITENNVLNDIKSDEVRTSICIKYYCLSLSIEGKAKSPVEVMADRLAATALLALRKVEVVNNVINVTMHNYRRNDRTSIKTRGSYTHQTYKSPDD